MDIRAIKWALRHELMVRILALDPEARRAQESALADGFASMPGYHEAATVLLYVSAFPEEIETGPMLRDVLARGKRLICPRVDRAGRRLRLYHIEDLEADLKRGTLGIPEPKPVCREVSPEAVDWALVPGLGFDARGDRLGRGAGHYDRLLPTLRAETPRWAVAFDCQFVEALPVAPHDMPLDGLALPGKRLSFPRSAKTQH
jgi:5-formyltetrahydrofolate cyclo-ligase